MGESAKTAAPPARRGIGDVLPQLGARFGLIGVWLALIALFAAINGEVFFTGLTAKTIASTQAVVAMVALAALLPLVVGQFDLSVGSQLGLAQVLCAGFIVNQELAPLLAVVLTLGAGVIYGLINGLLVTVLRINAFVATLATATLGLGVMQWYTKGGQISGNFPQSFLDLGRGTLAGVPLPFIYVVIVAAIIWVALEFTRWGRQAFATGGNARAALLSGIDTRRVTLQAFVAAGVVAALAGVIQVMVLGVGHPDIGPSFLLPAFAGVFLGAAVFRPGRFNSWGTVVAVYFLATGITGLQQLGAEFYIEQIFNGSALLIAVSISQLSAERRRRRPEVAEPA